MITFVPLQKPIKGIKAMPESVPCFVLKSGTYTITYPTNT